jgi:Cof subfamily protein (haloacid dehalogenase superfamily)
MAARKLLAFDLDGTLVTRDYQINQRTLDAVRGARAAGHAVTVITGRVEASARAYLEMLGVDIAFGTAQGACVHCERGSLLRDVRMSRDTLLELVRQFGAEAVEFFVPHGESVYVRDPKSKRADGVSYWAWIEAEGRGVHGIDALPLEDVYKISLHHSDLSVFAPKVMAAFPQQRYYPWGGQYLEVAHWDAHKGAALELIAGRVGVAREDVIAFGDGNNDLTMLEWAGHGVAVGYAEAHFAGVAQETVLTPEEFGVATWLERNLL